MSDQRTIGHPKGLYVLFITEMWERFSYYGMRAIFVLFLTKALVMSDKDASNIYGSFTGLVYLTPLIGGYISDRYWGNRRSIFIGGIMMGIGQILMFMSGNSLGTAMASPLMLSGLTLLIIGNGFFKPNISTMVGQLYPKGDGRIDGAFTIFYMGINLGAFFAPLICGGLGDTGDVGDFKWGFLAAGVGMIVSVITFEFLKNKYIIDPDGNAVGLPPSHYKSSAPSDQKEALPTNYGKMGMIVLIGVVLVYVFHNFMGLDLIGGFIFASAIAVPALIITDGSLSKDEKERIWVIFILAFFVVFFWSAFEQAGASLTIFADKQTDRHIGSWEMPASWFQSINPLGIILLAPLFSSMWVGMNRRKMEPSSPLKMAAGLALLCLGYIVIAMGVNGVDASTKISMWWLITLYILHTMGELCLSPIGLSMVSKLAPVRFASLLMGTWFLANAAANKLAGSLSALIPPGAGEAAVAAGDNPKLLGFEITNLFEFFNIFIVMSGAAAVILFILYRKLLKMMHGVN
ncbi:MAG: peptide MFS transporter [Bacteroidetes bacterium]|nr:peptide MFS transporter [Bacteroidota bacterium]